MEWETCMDIGADGYWIPPAGFWVQEMVHDGLD